MDAGKAPRHSVLKSKKARIKSIKKKIVFKLKCLQLFTIIQFVYN